MSSQSTLFARIDLERLHKTQTVIDAVQKIYPVLKKDHIVNAKLNESKLARY